jgi:hypothetical protein
MNEIVTERSASVLRVQLNRPAKKNAMTSSMYVTLADVFNDAINPPQRPEHANGWPIRICRILCAAETQGRRQHEKKTVS